MNPELNADRGKIVSKCNQFESLVRRVNWCSNIIVQCFYKTEPDEYVGIYVYKQASYVYNVSSYVTAQVKEYLDVSMKKIGKEVYMHMERQEEQNMRKNVGDALFKLRSSQGMIFVFVTSSAQLR